MKCDKCGRAIITERTETWRDIDGILYCKRSSCKSESDSIAEVFAFTDVVTVGLHGIERKPYPEDYNQ